MVVPGTAMPGTVIDSPSPMELRQEWGGAVVRTGLLPAGNSVQQEWEVQATLQNTRKPVHYVYTSV